MSRLFILLNYKYTSLLILLSLISSFYVLLSTSRFGAGLSYDSVYYIAAANNLIDGKGIVDFTNEPITNYPPFFPLVLGIVSFIFNTSPLMIANVLNAAFFGIIVYSSGIMFFRYTISVMLTFAGIGIILISRSVINVSIMAWSEPMFILIVLMFFLCLDIYLRKNNLIYLILLSILIVLLSFTRYIGITLAVLCIFSILFSNESNVKVKILHVVFLIVILVILLGAWLFRNHTISGTFFGPRSPSEYNFFDNIYLFFQGIYCWLLPGGIRYYSISLKILFGVTIFISLIVILSVLYKLTNKGNWKNLKIVYMRVNPIIMFIIIYTGFLLISSSTTYYDAINERLLSPIYIPMVLVLLVFIGWLTDIIGKRFSKKLINTILFTIVCVLLIPSIIYSINETRDYINQGVYGYNTTPWQDSEMVNYLRNHQLETNFILYSNEPEALYVLTNIISQNTPSRFKYHNPLNANTIWEVKTDWLVISKTYLVWFNNVLRSDLYTINELEQIINLSNCIHFKDGMICIISKKS